MHHRDQHDPNRVNKVESNRKQDDNEVWVCGANPIGPHFQLAESVHAQHINSKRQGEINQHLKS